MIWPYKGESLVSHENFCRFEKSVRHLVMKIILPDAESHEEHDETKYSPIGQAMVELRSFCVWM